MMTEFKKAYIDYLMVLVKENQDIKDRFYLANNYWNLSALSATVYEQVSDKQSWLESELNSLINKDNIPFDSNSEFDLIYQQSLLKFDLIHDFIIKNNIYYDLGPQLSIIFEYYSKKEELHKVLRIITNFLVRSIKSSIIIDLIIKILNEYFSDQDFADNTIIFELKAYINEFLNEKDILNIYKMFPDLK